MTLEAGTGLGVYENRRRAWRGRHARVCRARDTKQRREVTITIAPDTLAGDPRQHSRRRRQKPSVRRLKCRPLNLAAQDRQLVAQYDDLKFLEFVRAEQQEDNVQNALECDVKNRQDHGGSE
jgi:hypothetical protein